MLPKEHQIGRGCAGRYSLHLQYSPSIFKWLKLQDRSLHNDNEYIWEVCWQKVLPLQAESLQPANLAAMKQLHCHTHIFFYAKSSFPPLQRIVFLPAIQPHAAALQKWNYYWMEEVGDLWEVFLWKNNTAIRKSAMDVWLEIFPNLASFDFSWLPHLAAKQQNQTLFPG